MFVLSARGTPRLGRARSAQFAAARTLAAAHIAAMGAPAMTLMPLAVFPATLAQSRLGHLAGEKNFSARADFCQQDHDGDLRKEAVSRNDMTLHKGFHDMDKDRIEGTVKQAEGTIKEKVGQATGDTSLEIEGKVEKAEGTVQKAFGKVKDALRRG